MKKAFFDLGPGVLNSEAWSTDLWQDYTVIGLEPDPTRYTTLKETYPGMLLNLAVSDKPGKITGIIHDTSGFIMGGYPGYDKKTMVDAVTLDSIFEKYGPFDEVTIWADIEGSELRMLHGATETLKHTKMITVELHTGPKTTQWCKSYEVFKFLTELGFVSDISERPQTEVDDNYDVIFTKE